MLRQVEKHLKEAEMDKYGEFRGLEIYRLKCMHRGASIKGARKKLVGFIGKRHALRHGFHKLRYMVNANNDLAKSIFGRDSNIIITVVQARVILSQFWCYGRSKIYEQLVREEELQRQNGHLAPSPQQLILRTRKVDVRDFQLQSFAQELKEKIPAFKELDDGST